MDRHATDPGVFIRSMATRGHLGGLAMATPLAVRVLDAAGFDIVLIETVGVGQSEVDIVSLADTTVVLLAPGAGDVVQATKAGILELADVFVVNKSDHPDANRTVRDLRHVMSLVRENASDEQWPTPVVQTVATEATGIDEAADAVAAHRAWLLARGELDRRRARRAAREIESIALAVLRARLGDPRSDDRALLTRRVAAGDLDPYDAAEMMIRNACGPLIDKE